MLIRLPSFQTQKKNVGETTAHFFRVWSSVLFVFSCRLQIFLKLKLLKTCMKCKINVTHLSCRRNQFVWINQSNKLRRDVQCGGKASNEWKTSRASGKQEKQNRIDSWAWSRPDVLLLGWSLSRLQLGKCSTPTKWA